MGASAVLLFAVPSSPLAQPWSIVGGNMISALVGVACAHTIQQPWLAAAVAGSLAIAAMFFCRCVHPPGGAVAMTAVLGGEPISHLGYEFALVPVGLSCLSIVLIALMFNALLKRNYPLPVPAPARAPTSDPLPQERVGIRSDDVREALSAHQLELNIGQADLEAILYETEKRAYRRRFGGIRCDDIMSRDLIYVSQGATIEHGIAAMKKHTHDSLPVVEGDHLVGVLTLKALLASADDLQGSIDPYVISVPAVSPQTPIDDLITPLAEAAGHRLPVTDEHNRLIGIVSQTDLVAALFRSSLETPTAAGERS
jgi:CBS domain-containing membrane protein